MKIAFKYNIQSRGIEGRNNTWTIYKNIDQGMEDTITTDHLEFEVPISTCERHYPELGFGMLCEGKMSHDINDLDGTAYVRIVNEKK